MAHVTYYHVQTVLLQELKVPDIEHHQIQPHTHTAAAMNYAYLLDKLFDFKAMAPLLIKVSIYCRAPGINAVVFLGRDEFVSIVVPSMGSLLILEQTVRGLLHDIWLFNSRSRYNKCVMHGLSGFYGWTGRTGCSGCTTYRLHRTYSEHRAHCQGI